MSRNDTTPEMSNPFIKSETQFNTYYMIVEDIKAKNAKEVIVLNKPAIQDTLEQYYRALKFFKGTSDIHTEKATQITSKESQYNGTETSKRNRSHISSEDTQGREVFFLEV